MSSSMFPAKNSCRESVVFYDFFTSKSTCLNFCIGLMPKEDGDAHAISMDASKEEILAAYFQLENVHINLRSTLEDQQVKFILWVVHFGG